jgi:hypothetical protein
MTESKGQRSIHLIRTLLRSIIEVTSYCSKYILLSTLQGAYGKCLLRWVWSMPGTCSLHCESIREMRARELQVEWIIVREACNIKQLSQQLFKAWLEPCGLRQARENASNIDVQNVTREHNNQLPNLR